MLGGCRPTLAGGQRPSRFSKHLVIYLGIYPAFRPMKSVPASAQAPAEINGDTPTLRLWALLETVASKDQPFALRRLAQETDIPKPTLHRVLSSRAWACRRVARTAGDTALACGGASGQSAHQGVDPAFTAGPPAFALSSPSTPRQSDSAKAARVSCWPASPSRARPSNARRVRRRRRGRCRNAPTPLHPGHAK